MRVEEAGEEEEENGEPHLFSKEKQTCQGGQHAREKRPTHESGRRSNECITTSQKRRICKYYESLPTKIKDTKKGLIPLLNAYVREAWPQNRLRICHEQQLYSWLSMFSDKKNEGGKRKRCEHQRSSCPLQKTKEMLASLFEQA